MTFNTPKLSKISFHIQSLHIAILAGVKTATVVVKTTKQEELTLRASRQELIDTLMRAGKNRALTASVSRQKSKNIIISLS